MSKDGIRVVARVNVRTERLVETLEAVKELVAATRVEAGCIKYEALQNLEDPHEITFVEEWASSQALDEHFATDHFKAVAALSGELFTSAPDIRRYSVFA